MRPVSVFVVVVALLIAVTVVWYVRRWRLKEEYSLLWLVLAVSMVVPAAAPGLVEWFADQLEVIDAPALLFFIALAFVAVMLFHYSLELSRLSDENRQLAQDLAILRTTIGEEPDQSEERTTSEREPPG